MCFLAFSQPGLTQLSFQSHQLLFSHASAEVSGKIMLERKFASTGFQTHNHRVMSLTHWANLVGPSNWRNGQGIVVYIGVSLWVGPFLCPFLCSFFCPHHISATAWPILFNFTDKTRYIAKICMLYFSYGSSSFHVVIPLWWFLAQVSQGHYSVTRSKFLAGYSWWIPGQKLAHCCRVTI